MIGPVLGLFPSPGVVGGVERSGFEAWRAITESSRESNHLVCYGPPMSDEINAQIERWGGTLFHTRSQAMSALRVVSTQRHVRMVLVWHLGMLRLLPFVRGTGARTILYLHGIEAWQPVSGALVKLLRRVDLFLSNSDYTWQRFLDANSHLPDLRAAAHRTVALGLGEVSDCLACRPTDRPTTVMVGRIARQEAYKGHDAVIGAWNGVLSRIPGARLQLIGPSEMTEDLRALSESNGVAQSVEFLGSVSEEEKMRRLAEARCMALPSRGEGFGLAYVEAMRMGRPCLVSTLDAGREVVCPMGEMNPAGIAVDPDNRAALTSALVRLMTHDAEWDSFSTAATARYARLYTGAGFRSRLTSALEAIA